MSLDFGLTRVTHLKCTGAGCGELYIGIVFRECPKCGSALRDVTNGTPSPVPSLEPAPMPTPKLIEELRDLVELAHEVNYAAFANAPFTGQRATALQLRLQTLLDRVAGVSERAEPAQGCLDCHATHTPLAQANRCADAVECAHRRDPNFARS